MAMLKSRTYVISGDPIPLQRPRSNVRGRPWDPQKIEKNNWIAQIELQHEDMPMYTSAIIFEVTFNFRVPEIHKKIKTDLIGKPHIYRPDLSNLVKFVEDCAQAVLYRDDCIIADIRARKIYNETAYTEFTIIPLL